MISKEKCLPEKASLGVGLGSKTGVGLGSETPIGGEKKSSDTAFPSIVHVGSITPVTSAVDSSLSRLTIWGLNY